MPRRPATPYLRTQRTERLKRKKKGAGKGLGTLAPTNVQSKARLSRLDGGKCAVPAGSRPHCYILLQACYSRDRRPTQGDTRQLAAAALLCPNVSFPLPARCALHDAPSCLHRWLQRLPGAGSARVGRPLRKVLNLASQMALVALDFGLQLDPLGMDVTAADGDAAAIAAGAAPPSTSAASADTACWVVQPAKLPRWVQQQQQQHGEEQDDGYLSDPEEQCTVSPGCSFSGAAALDAAVLALEDDACSAPAPAEAEAAVATKRLKLPDGTALVAASFLHDLAARGSLYDYCTKRR